MNFSNLLANYIVEKGISLTSGFDYEVSFVDLLKEFDDELMKYIYEHTEEIYDAISQNEKVADVYLDGGCSFSMVYYWSYCLDEHGKKILEVAEKNNIELEYEELLDLKDKLQKYDISKRDKFILKEIKNRGIKNAYER